MKSSSIFTPPKVYITPQVDVTAALPEGILCASVYNEINDIKYEFDENIKD